MVFRPNVFFLAWIFSALLIVALVGCEFDLPDAGCPMAHCDAQMTDNTQQRAPSDASYYLWWDMSIGSSFGLGCVSNGSRAACSYMNNQDVIKVYDYYGTLKWQSGDVLNYNAWTSAPIIDKNNHVIAADDNHVVRFDANGEVLWEADMPGGMPISPVLNALGVLLVATANGPISTFDPTLVHGQEVLDSKWVSYGDQGQITLQDSQPANYKFYETINTPAFNSTGTRAYVAMARDNDDTAGVLVALDVSPNGGLSLAWTYLFTGPSGASPLVVENVGENNLTVIYFDGRYESAEEQVAANAEILAVVDRGNLGEELWRHRETPSTYFIRQKTIDTSFTADTQHNCMWYFSSSWDRTDPATTVLDDPYLRCLDYGNGAVMKQVDPGRLLPPERTYANRYFPASLLSMTQDADGEPVLIFNIIGTVINNSYRPNKIVAVRPWKDTENSSGKLLWSFALPNTYSNGLLMWFNATQGQFPILVDPNTAEGDPNPATRIIFTTHADGFWLIGEP